AENGTLEDGHAGEERRQEMRDHLLQRHVQATAAEFEKPRQALRDLDACEALLARVGVLREDRELEAPCELAELLVREILDSPDGDSLGGEGGPQVSLPEP